MGYGISAKILWPILVVGQFQDSAGKINFYSLLDPPLTSTATLTNTPTATLTATLTATATFTASPTAPFTASPTATFTASPTATFTTTPTATFTTTPTATPVASVLPRTVVPEKKIYLPLIIR